MIALQPPPLPRFNIDDAMRWSGRRLAAKSEWRARWRVAVVAARCSRGVDSDGGGGGGGGGDDGGGGGGGDDDDDDDDETTALSRSLRSRQSASGDGGNGGVRVTRSPLLRSPPARSPLLIVVHRHQHDNVGRVRARFDREV